MFLFFLLFWKILNSEVNDQQGNYSLNGLYRDDLVNVANVFDGSNIEELYSDECVHDKDIGANAQHPYDPQNISKKEQHILSNNFGFNETIFNDVNPLYKTCEPLKHTNFIDQSNSVPYIHLTTHNDFQIGYNNIDNERASTETYFQGDKNYYSKYFGQNIEEAIQSPNCNVVPVENTIDNLCLDPKNTCLQKLHLIQATNLERKDVNNYLYINAESENEQASNIVEKNRSCNLYNDIPTTTDFTPFNKKNIHDYTRSRGGVFDINSEFRNSENLNSHEILTMVPKNSTYEDTLIDKIHNLAYQLLEAQDSQSIAAINYQKNTTIDGHHSNAVPFAAISHIDDQQTNINFTNRYFSDHRLLRTETPLPMIDHRLLPDFPIDMLNPKDNTSYAQAYFDAQNTYQTNDTTGFTNQSNTFMPLKSSASLLYDPVDNHFFVQEQKKYHLQTLKTGMNPQSNLYNEAMLNVSSEYPTSIYSCNKYNGARSSNYLNPECKTTAHFQNQNNIQPVVLPNICSKPYDSSLNEISGPLVEFIDINGQVIAIDFNLVDKRSVVMCSPIVFSMEYSLYCEERGSLILIRFFYNKRFYILEKNRSLIHRCRNSKLHISNAISKINEDFRYKINPTNFIAGFWESVPNFAAYPISHFKEINGIFHIPQNKIWNLKNNKKAIKKLELSRNPMFNERISKLKNFIKNVKIQEFVWVKANEYKNFAAERHFFALKQENIYIAQTISFRGFTIYKREDEKNDSFILIAHNISEIFEDFIWGNYTLIMKFSKITMNVKVGNENILDNNSSVYNNVVIDDNNYFGCHCFLKMHSKIGKGNTFTSRCLIGHQAVIGNDNIFEEGCDIKKGSVVGDYNGFPQEMIINDYLRS